MTPQELAQFIQYIKSANTGQISVLLRILGNPLAEPMESETAERICSGVKKQGKNILENRGK